MSSIARTTAASLTPEDAATLPRDHALLRYTRRLVLILGLMAGFLLLGLATGVAHADSGQSTSSSKSGGGHDSSSGGNAVTKVTSAAEKAVSSATGKSAGIMCLSTTWRS